MTHQEGHQIGVPACFTCCLFEVRTAPEEQLANSGWRLGKTGTEQPKRWPEGEMRMRKLIGGKFRVRSMVSIEAR